MIKQCPTCHSVVRDECVICPNCHTSLAPTPTTATYTPATKTSSPLKIILPIIGGIVVLVVALLLIIDPFTPGYEKAINTFLDLRNGDYDLIEQCAPPEWWDAQDEDVDDIQADFEDKNEEQLAFYEDTVGANPQWILEIVDADEVSNRTLEEIQDIMKERYDISRSSVTAAYELEITSAIEGDDDREEFDGDSVHVVEIDGEWYLCDTRWRLSADDLF